MHACRALARRRAASRRVVSTVTDRRAFSFCSDHRVSCRAPTALRVPCCYSIRCPRPLVTRTADRPARAEPKGARARTHERERRERERETLHSPLGFLISSIPSVSPFSAPHAIFAQTDAPRCKVAL